MLNAEKILTHRLAIAAINADTKRFNKAQPWFTDAQEALKFSQVESGS